MRLIFTIITAIAFGTTAFAEIQCKEYKSLPVNQEILGLVSNAHPDITGDNLVERARSYQLILKAIDNSQDETLPAEHRKLQQRIADVSSEMLVLKDTVAQKLPEFLSVLNKMEVEKEAGLVKVSADLLPEVRRTASVMVGIGQRASEIALEISKVAESFFLLESQEGHARALAAAEKSLCAWKSSVDLSRMVAVSVKAIALVAVKNLHY